MSQIVSGFVISNGAAINVDIGFKPDFVELFNFDAGATANLGLTWYRCLADAPQSAANGRYGVSTVDAGDITYAADANNGIIPYDGTKMPGVLVESPVPEKGDVAVPCHNYAYQIANTVTPTERAATVIGTMVRPNTGNGYVYECTTTAGACAVEPTWPITPGDTVQDSGNNVWTCREENITTIGGMGFTIGGTLAATADDFIVFKAERHDKSGDMGDAAGQDPVKYPIRGT